jgi:hypothetical protein
MSSTSIIDELKQQLGPDTVQQLSGQLGVTPDAASNAISMALPILLGGLSTNASNPQGAADLDRALGAHDGSILGNLGSMLGGGAGGGIGGAILGHILGSRQPPVEQGIGRATGMDAAKVSQLLIMLAPIVMAVLGRMKKQGGVTAEELPKVLQQGQKELETQEPATAGLGGIFDRNNDGNIADDIARMGGSVLGGLFKR